MNITQLESFKLSDAIKFHDKLNPKLFANNKPRHEVKKQLLIIAKDFISELGIKDLDVKDVTISGSNAAYTYTPHSDLDLHILVDMSKLPNDEVYRELFNAKKTIYNDSHEIKVHGVPVELYVQDSNEPVVSLGEYSLLQNKWLRIPVKRRASFDQTIAKSKYNKLYDLVQTALRSKDHEKVTDLLKTLRRYRQVGLDKGGEFSPENLAYKALRSQGWLTKLYDLRDKLHSKSLSIENAEKILDKPTLSPAQLAKKHNVSLDHILSQLKKGIKVELEHTSNKTVAKEIASDHLSEDPNYYTKLLKAKLEEDTKNAPNVLYHVTPLSNLTNIKKNGLLPEKSRGYQGVYLANDKHHALGYIGHHDADDYALLSIDVSKLDENKLEPDDVDFPDILSQEDESLSVDDYDWVDSLNMSGQCKYMGVIGINAITKIVHASKAEEIKEEKNTKAISLTNYFFDNSFDPKIKQYILDHQFNNPTLSCQNEVSRWAKKLNNAGLDVEIHHGFYVPNNDQDSAEGHTWLEVEGSIFDPTAGQFDDQGEGEYQVHEVEELNEDSTPAKIAYHVTLTKNLRKIMKQGLIPRIGARSAKIKDEEQGIYMFPDKTSVDDALMNWLGDEFDEDEELTLLAIDITGLRTVKGADYEIIVKDPIDPSRITVTSELLEASGYIPSKKEANDPRYKTALTVDVKPDAIKKNAKAFGFNVNRSGIPPLLRK